MLLAALTQSAQAAQPIDEAEFNSLLERRSQLIYKLAFAKCGNQADAEDVFQQVFLRYLSRRPNFASPEHEKAWFIRVTLNCSKSLWGSAFRRHTQPLSQDIPAEEADPFPQLGEYLARLPEEQRVLLHLFYYEDMSTAQIAQALHRREGTVRMQLTRARRALGELLQGDEEFWS